MARKSPVERTHHDRTAEEAVVFATRRIKELGATPRWVVGQPLESPSAWAFHVESDAPVAARFGLLVVDKRKLRLEQWLDTEGDGWPDGYEQGRVRRAAVKRKALPKEDVPFLLGVLGAIVAVVVIVVLVPVVGKLALLGVLVLGLLWQPLKHLRWRWRFRRGLTVDEARLLAIGMPRRVGATPRRPIGEPLAGPSHWAFRVETEDPLAAEAFGLLTVDRHDGWVEQLPAGIPETDWSEHAERRRAERLAREGAAKRRELRRRWTRMGIAAALAVGLFAVLWFFSSGFPGWLGGALAFLLLALFGAIPEAAKGFREDYRREVDVRRRVALEPSPTHRAHRAPPRDERDRLEPFPITRT